MFWVKTEKRKWKNKKFLEKVPLKNYFQFLCVYRREDMNTQVKKLIIVNMPLVENIRTERRIKGNAKIYYLCNYLL